MPYTHPEQLHDAFAEAFNSGHPDALIDLYEPDAIQLGRSGQVISGRDQLRSVFVGLLAAGITLQGTQVKALVAGDLALTSTQYAVDTTAPDGAQRTALVHTAEVSRRQSDGSWRVVIDAPGFA